MPGEQKAAAVGNCAGNLVGSGGQGLERRAGGMLMAGVVYVPWLAVRLFRSPGAGREEFPLTTVSF